MKHKRSLLRIFLVVYLPLLVWLGVIYMFSSQTHDQQDIKPWLNKAIPLQKLMHVFGGIQIEYGGKDISIKADGASGFVEFFIRKGAHLIVYAILGILLYSFLHYVIRARAYWKYLITILLSGIYATTDEFHQKFVQFRTPTLSDIVLDTLGAALGAGVYLLLAWLISSLRKPRYLKQTGDNS
jgi:VanZ family protein